jgi:hypothetical protein
MNGCSNQGGLGQILQTIEQELSQLLGGSQSQQPGQANGGCQSATGGIGGLVQGIAQAASTVLPILSLL